VACICNLATAELRAFESGISGIRRTVVYTADVLSVELIQLAHNARVIKLNLVAQIGALGYSI